MLLFCENHWIGLMVEGLSPKNFQNPNRFSSCRYHGHHFVVGLVGFLVATFCSGFWVNARTRLSMQINSNVGVGIW